jgi:hypothetical protein
MSNVPLCDGRHRSSEGRQLLAEIGPERMSPAIPKSLADRAASLRRRAEVDTGPVWQDDIRRFLDEMIALTAGQKENSDVR